MENVAADFTINNNNNPLQAEYTLGESQHFDCSFELFASGTLWGSIDGNIQDQTDLYNILSTYEGQIDSNHNEITAISRTIQSYGDIVSYNAADFATSAQGALASTALQPGDNITELTNNAGYTSNIGTVTSVNNTQPDANGNVTITIPDSATWGNITGDIDDQTDLKNALATKYDASNPNGYITSSALTNYVTTNTAQTISANKTFHNAEIITDNMITLNGSTSLIRGLTGINYRNLIKLNSSGITIGSTHEVLTLQGSGARPKYNTGDLALYTDLPTVNDGKLTLQVNSVDVGEFTANQSSTSTINITVPTDTSDLTNGAGFLINNATGTNALAVGNTSQSTAEGGVAIGYGSKANSTYSTAIGQNASATNTNTTVIGRSAKATQARAIAIGSGAEANAQDAISIKGINNTANTFQVYTYNMLDMSTGLIPDARISTNIARSADVPAPQVQADWNEADPTSMAYIENKPTIPPGVVVDQTYDATSANAQSGVAIAGAGFLTGITSGDVTTALGYTPVNPSNLATVATSGDYDDLTNIPTNYVTTDTDQNITGTKTFVGQKKIAFKQSSSSDKLGFTLYNNSGTEKGYLEYNPSNTVDSVPLMTLGNYATASAGLAHVGFRKYSNISGANGAYNLLAPLISDAKTPFSLTTTYTNFYMPLGFTDGNSTVKTAKSGLVDLSSILPTVNNSTITFTQGGVTKGTITLNQASNGTIALDAGGSGGIQNTATGTDSLTIMGTPTAGESCINIGVGSQTSSYTSNVAIGAEYDTDAGANARGDYGVSIGTASIADENAVSLGYHAQATGITSTAIGSGTVASGSSSVSVGKGAEATAQRAIQIGEGANSTASSLKVGFGTSATNYQLLDGTTGLIPDARISSNIARTSQIPTVPTNISAFTNDSGYITGITSSDVTTALGYTPYNSTNPDGYITGVTSSDIITALGYTPANDTLSNLGATASTNFDGEWVIKNITIAASVSWDGSSDDATYSIANQLPNDSYTYEVLITGVATAAAIAGRFMTIQLTTDVQTSSVYLCGARSSSSIQNQTVGSVLIRVGSARTITQYSTTAAAANGTYSLYLKGYRRVGTNT